MGPPDSGESLGVSTVTRLVYLHLSGQPRPIMRALDGESDEALARRCLAKWPMLPVTHLTVEDTPLMDFFVRGEGQTMHSGVAGAGVGPKRAGASRAGEGAPVNQSNHQSTSQPVKQSTKRKQGYAERYRQHWIDKDNAKQRQGHNKPPEA